MSYRDQIKDLDLDQLVDFRSVISDAISRKQDEKKLTVWRVISRGLCYGNFRHDEYMKAVACLAKQAEEFFNDGAEYEMSMEIVAEKIPESEYEDWFND
ncbi:TPA: hypothetical protein ACS773_002117 [Providencia alcalifaciens]